MKKNKKQADLYKRQPIKRVITDPATGLSTEQVREYKRCGWDNRPVDAPSKTVAQILKTNIFTYFNLIFAIISVLLILVGAFRDLSFLPIIIANALIGIIQELNAKKTLDKLTVLNAPKSHVLRNGTVKSVPCDRLVLDDIVVFGSGNQIPADAIVVEGEVSVNESLLTGESDEITKKVGDSLMSGSFIVSGKCKARLDKVGEDSYISKLTIQAKATKSGEQSEMIRSLNNILKIVGVIIIPIGIILFVQSYMVAQNDIKTSVQSMVAAIIGMIPEGLYLLTSVTMVTSTVRLAISKVLVHDMKCIEALARVDTLCVDKTGTITSNDMTVNDIVVLDEYDEEEDGDLNELLSDFAAAMASDNITMEALKAFFKSPTGRKADKITSFSSANKYSSATFSNNAYVLGAPEFVLRHEYDDYREDIEEQSSKGFRVLVFGLYDGVPNGGPLTGDVIPLCLILLSNPIRNDAKETFGFFKEQGVEIKVISGDNPITVSQVAAKAGIPNADRYIDASTLTNSQMIKKAVLEYNVFGRVTPSQKLEFVKVLKEAGRTVAMTGDGVNDVLALKEADCSVAMASGSDAAAQVSQLVLLESDFSRMPQVVAEGRQVVNNLERSGALFLVKNIFSLLMAVFSIAFSLTYPLEPSQISLISMFTIGVPGFLLSQLPNKELIKGRFLTNILIKACPAGLTDAVIVGALVIFGQVFAVSSSDISVASTMLLIIVGFMILYNLSKPMDKMKWGIFAICIVGVIIAIVFFHQIFAVSSISLRCVCLLIVFSIITEPLLRYLSQLTKFLRNKYLKLRHRENEMI